MEAPTPRIRPVSATLMPECSIRLEVAMDGWDEPQTTVIDQSADFLTRVGNEPRAIDLEGLGATDLLAQQHITRHISRIERELERQRAYERYAC